MSAVATIIGKPVENRYLVREKDRRRSRDLGMVALALAPLALVLIGFAWANVEVIRRGYELESRKTVLHELVEKNRRLRSQAAAGRSLADVEVIARRDMHFVDPTASQQVWLVSPREERGK